MAFKSLTSKVRRSPLGYASVNNVLENLDSNYRLLAREHLDSGVHNALEIPRAVGTCHYNSGWTLVGASDSALSITSNGTGDITVNLDDDFFPGTPLIVRAAGMAGTGSVFYLVSHEVLSRTQVRFEVWEYASGGFTKANASFCFAIHAEPLPATRSASWNDIDRRGRAVHQGLDATLWSDMLENDTFLRAALLQEHTSAGAHNSREVPRLVAGIRYNGGTSYSVAYQSGGISSLSRVSAGVIDITLTGSTFLNETSPEVQVFVNAIENGAIYAAWVPTAGLTNTGDYLTTMRVYLYKNASTFPAGGFNSSNTWAATDNRFNLALHCAPN
jgi:hypothetical protein